MIECPACDGKGGFVIVDSASPGCDETDEIEECHKCKGSCHLLCECCGNAATQIVKEDNARFPVVLFFCESCAKG